MIPWCEKHGSAVVVYSPFGHGRFPSLRATGGRVLKQNRRRAQGDRSPSRDPVPGAPAHALRGSQCPDEAQHGAFSATEKKNVTSVIVTHEMDSAFRIATRMATLYHGKIIQDDVPEKVKYSKNPIVHQFVTGELAGPITEMSNDTKSSG